MILFITDYDNPTHSNLCVGRDLIPLSNTSLLGENAVKENLLNQINMNPTFPLFAMSHGKRDCLQAQNGTIGIDVTDADQLNQRIVFAWACNTAIELGRAVWFSGGIWWGYTGKIAAPNEEEPFRQIFSTIFQFIHNSFRNATSTNQIQNILNEIKNQCESAIENVDSFLENNQNIDVMETYFCLNQIWRNLRVWCPDEESPIYHPETPVPILD